ncbi:MAG: xylulokinase [Termitinemataceae bacterium]|nr:MAG: xylulokinase [Termitinemataceae bacterium]
MSLLMGIDLGTSSLKTMILDSQNGSVVSQAAENYQFDSPSNGYAEQEAQVWWNALVNTVKSSLSLSLSAPVALSFSGQMHGAVLLDENYEVLRPVILHCDTRSLKQVTALKALFAEKKFPSARFNPVYTGFLLASLLWVRENEGEIYKKLRHVCLPKDYLKLKLCGTLNTDYSDASGTLAFDVENWCWASDIIKALDIDESIFPPAVSAATIAGRVVQSAANETGLSSETLVITGGSDQLMQAIGNGAINAGQATINIGSSGQVCFQSDKAIVNPKMSTNTFCAADKGAWFTMGATMSAGLALKWFSKNIADFDFSKIDEEVSKTQSSGLLFLPYLSGERTPHLKSDLRAAFLGMSLTTTKWEMARCAIEGVAFSLYDCIYVCEDLGLKADEAIASGGGARSHVWLQIQADIYGLPLKTAKNEEQACVGAAAIAGFGCGVYSSLKEATEALVCYKDKYYMPDIKRHQYYMELYRLYGDAYRANEHLLTHLSGMRRYG